MSTIKAGYRLSVTAWENDADNYTTITKDGLTKDYVHSIVNLLSLLRKSHHSGGWGNLYEPSERKLEDFADAILELGEDVVAYITEGFLSKDPAELPYQYAEFISQYTSQSDVYFTRVVERIRVEYVPQEITIEDVSSQFGV